MNDTCLIDDFGPLPLVRPRSVAELGDIIRAAAAKQQSLYPVGGGTQLDLGNVPTRQGSVIALGGLDQVIDFPARDMTITVQAGITIARLQALLAPENLRLPIDVPRAEQATLGGILATNVSGPRRLGYGTLRDYVIGISAVNDEGQEFKAGGRVVKNVAGYDLCKLLVGSLGTLGIITQATLKLRPGAEQTALVAIGCEADQLEGLLVRLHASGTRPVALELANAAAAEAIFAGAEMPPPSASWVVIVGYEGNAAAVNWQVQQLRKELEPQRLFAEHLGPAAQALWQALVEWPAMASVAVSLKASLRPGEVAAFCRAGEAPVQVKAHAGSGIAYGSLQNECSEQDASRLVHDWRTRAGQSNGTLIVPRCPAAWKGRLNVWGPPPGDVPLMRAVKAQFDPRGLFNPGRFVDGI